MQELLEILKRRRSVRVYQDRPVERDTHLAILEAARAAPSAGNLQAFQLVVVQDSANKHELSHAALDQKHVESAPAVVVFFADPGRSATYGARADLYSRQDATIACAHAQLAATALGLGCCWIGAFYPDTIRQLLKAPAGLEPVALLTVGYPAEQPVATERRPLDEMVRWEGFQQS